MNNATGVQVGDRVRWECLAGTMYGEITAIRLDMNAKNELIPWLSIEYISDNKAKRIVLCGTNGYLKMMKFSVIFRDKVAV